MRCEKLYKNSRRIITLNATTKDSVTVSSCLIRRMWERPVKSQRRERLGEMLNYYYREAA